MLGEESGWFDDPDAPGGLRLDQDVLSELVDECSCCVESWRNTAVTLESDGSASTAGLQLLTAS